MAHQRAVEVQRGSSTERGYGGTWRSIRAAVLRAEPLCRQCTFAGRVTAAVDVDHIIARRKGGSDDRSNLQPLCGSHHKAKTVRETAFGRKP